MKTLINFIPFIASFMSYGQGKFVTEIYRVQTTQCNIDWTVTYSYVLQVFSDKTTKFDMYTDYYRYMSVRFRKNTFAGVANITNDTLQISWLSTSSLAVTNYQPIYREGEHPISKADMVPPPAVFIVKNHSVSPTNLLLPVMGEIELDKLIVFENGFEDRIRKSDKRFGKL